MPIRPPSPGIGTTRADATRNRRTASGENSGEAETSAKNTGARVRRTAPMAVPSCSVKRMFGEIVGSWSDFTADAAA